MLARDICVREVIFLRRSDLVTDAARLMREHHVGSIVVIDETGGRRVPVGILTDRDIVVGVVAQAAETLQGLRVGDVVTRPVVTAREDESVHDVVKRMRTNGVRRMPVVGDDGALVGLVAVDDLIDLVAEELTDLAKLIGREQAREHRTRR